MGREKRLKEPDSFNKTAVINNHDHVDRIEVFLTAEASGEIGLRISCGMKIATEWTEKAEIVLGVLKKDVKS